MTRNEKLREILTTAKRHNDKVLIIGNDFQVKGLVNDVYHYVDRVVIFTESLGYITIHFDKIISLV